MLLTHQFQVLCALTEACAVFKLESSLFQTWNLIKDLTSEKSSKESEIKAGGNHLTDIKEAGMQNILKSGM